MHAALQRNGQSPIPNAYLVRGDIWFGIKSVHGSLHPSYLLLSDKSLQGAVAKDSIYWAYTSAVWAGLSGKSLSLPLEASTETAQQGMEDTLPRRCTHQAGEVELAVGSSLCGSESGSLHLLTQNEEERHLGCQTGSSIKSNVELI